MLAAQIARLTASLFLCSVVICAPLFAQTQAPTGTQSPKAILVDPERAQVAMERGDEAAANGRLEEALAAYDEAARFAPQEMAAITRGAVLRAKLVGEHTANAEKLALAGNISQAIAELRLAQRVDATNAVVAERMAEMEAMNDDEPAARQAQSIEGMPQLKTEKGKHSLDLRGDTKSAYNEVAQIFGIKTVFDADLQTRNVKLRVDDVDFATAMTLLSEQTGTFWRPLSANQIFVTPDTPEKRRQYAVEAEQTFPLSASVAPEEMTELLRVLREITGSTHVELDTHTRAITMRDTPERLTLASELLSQVERARGELMLEVELLEVDRNKALQLGIAPPTSAQAFLISPNDITALSKASDLSNALTILGQLFSAQGLSSVPGFILFGGGNSTFLLTVPAVAANFSDALTLVQSGTQVLMRAQDGKPATFFVGDRFPITLSLLSGSLGTGTGTATNPNSVIGAVPSSTTFPETTFSVGNNPVALAAAAYSGGTLPDLAVANENDNTISILLNQDNGNFVAQANSPFTLAKGETGPVSIAAGTFGNTAVNSNGVTVSPEDLVIANSTSNNVTVLLGNGDGTFTEAAGSPYAVGTEPSSVVVADFNGDGNLDFAVANKGDNTISVFKGDGKGGFTAFPKSPYALQNNATISEKGPVAMATANFKNTTLPNLTAPEVDLAIANETTNNVTILLGSIDSNGNLLLTEANSSPLAVGTTPVAIAAGDLNTDGIPDLAVVNQGDNSVSIILASASANADATFSAAAGSPLATATTPAGIVIANFTGGNVPSLAVTNQGQSTLGIYIGLGGGTFSNRLEIAAPASPSAIISATLTSSGLPDVALTALGSTANQGVVTIFQDSSTFATGTTPTQTPYPGAEYVDLGVKVKATPTLHTNHEVTLQLEFEIRALSGNSINGIPILSNRTLSQVVRVKDDETTLIGGLLDEEETRAIAGLPGLANIPQAGYAFGTHNNTLQETEFMILVTPRRLRAPVRTGRNILAGRGDPGARGSVGAGVPQPAPQEAQPPATPPTQQPVGPTPVPNPNPGSAPNPNPPPQP